MRARAPRSALSFWLRKGGPGHPQRRLPGPIALDHGIPASFSLISCPTATPPQRGASRSQDPSRLIADVGKESSHEIPQDVGRTQDVPGQACPAPGSPAVGPATVPRPHAAPGPNFWAGPETFPSVLCSSEQELSVQQEGVPLRFSPGFK